MTIRLKSVIVSSANVGDLREPSQRRYAKAPGWGIYQVIRIPSPFLSNLHELWRAVGLH
jgi:hypothetical protein